jgi:phosphomannomutase/phosphoglucomutase
MSEQLKIDPYGFREYDARWLYEESINKLGITNLGKGLGTQIINHTKKNNPRVIVGHDYRSYSEEIKTGTQRRINFNRLFELRILVCRFHQWFILHSSI